jgi:predicted RNase H-like HicB family nuclease
MDEGKAKGRVYAAKRIEAYKSLLKVGGEAFVVKFEGEDPSALTRGEVEERIRQHEDYLRATDPRRPDHTRLCNEILRWPYHWCAYPNGDGSARWSARIVEFPGCVACGKNAEDAISQLRSAAESWVTAVLERDGHHMNIPAPYKGKKEFRPFHQGHLDEAADAAKLEALKQVRARANSMLKDIDNEILNYTEDVHAHPELFTVQVAPDA